ATRVLDSVRGHPWPDGYTSRVLRSPFIERWHGHDGELAGQLPELAERYRRAVADEDYDVVQIAVGEGIGIIDEVRTAGEVVEAMVREAATALAASRPGPG
ncbi:MAG: hypothetical protein L0I24_06380, partial [Pseudonocardia sp.]|nr:hypothetical protein [Pseudonocardia sp.]